MPVYEFTIKLTFEGENAKEAWKNNRDTLDMMSRDEKYFPDFQQIEGDLPEVSDELLKFFNENIHDDSYVLSFARGIAALKQPELVVEIDELIEKVGKDFQVSSLFR